jgi:hypothetical protein
VFEEIERKADERETVIAPQNHPFAFVSFVWDNTVDSSTES